VVRSHPLSAHYGYSFTLKPMLVKFKTIPQAHNDSAITKINHLIKKQGILKNLNSICISKYYKTINIGTYRLKNDG
jgi:hypothetical protein